MCQFYQKIKQTLKMFQVPFRGTSVERGDSDLTFVTCDSDLTSGTWTRGRSLGLDLW